MIDKTLLISGDIFLFHSRGFNPFSMGIRELTGSFWNHTGLYYIDLYNQGFIIEALGGGVVKTPIEKYLDEKRSVLRVVRIKPEAFRDILEYDSGIALAIGRIKDKIGLKYDWGAIAWLGIKYIFKGMYKKGRTFIPVGNPLQSREKFFCSELICEGFRGISSLHPYLFQGKTLQRCDTTTPRDISKSMWVKFVDGKDLI